MGAASQMQNLDDDLYSPVSNSGQLYSPNMINHNQVNSHPNNMQNVDGLSNLPPNMREHVLSGLNNINSSNMQFNNLPNMNQMQQANNMMGQQPFMGQMQQANHMMGQQPYVNDQVNSNI